MVVHSPCRLRSQTHGVWLMADVAIGLDEITRHFDELEDPRSTLNQLHPFVSVVVIARMGVLAGASGPTAIARWAQFKKPFL